MTNRALFLPACRRGLAVLGVTLAPHVPCLLLGLLAPALLASLASFPVLPALLAALASGWLCLRIGAGRTVLPVVVLSSLAVGLLMALGHAPAAIAGPAALDDETLALISRTLYCRSLAQ